MQLELEELIVDFVSIVLSVDTMLHLLVCLCN